MRKTCLNKVYELAQRDPRVVFIGSDLGPGVLHKMKEEMPDRFYMEGIAEQNVIGMAAGMALEGYVPYVNTIATFLTRRCFEQVAIDVCLHNLPVRLIGNGGGLVYAPLGPTHEAIEDIAIMRALPNMTVISVSDAEEMAVMMDQTLDWPGPIYIRLGKGGDPIVSDTTENFRIGKAICKREGADAALVTTGVLVKPCLDAAKTLRAEGLSCAVVHLPTVKPIDTDGLVAALPAGAPIICVEEHLRTGGLGSTVLETLSDRHGGLAGSVVRHGLPDEFVHTYGSQNILWNKFGLDAEGIAANVRATLQQADN
jgi:transketolase